MSPQESDSKDFDWTAVERAVETELLDRAKRVARRVVERVRQVTDGVTGHHRLGPNDPTEVCEVVGN
jgi:hypothetical protein